MVNPLSMDTLLCRVLAGLSVDNHGFHLLNHDSSPATREISSRRKPLSHPAPSGRKLYLLARFLAEAGLLVRFLAEAGLRARFLIGRGCRVFFFVYRGW